MFICIPFPGLFSPSGFAKKSAYSPEDAARVVPASMLGSAVAGGLAMASRVTTEAAHGGVFVAPTSNNIALWFLYLVIGSVITGVVYAIIKKTPSEEDTVEEEVVDLDIDI